MILSRCKNLVRPVEFALGSTKDTRYRAGLAFESPAIWSQGQGVVSPPSFNQGRAMIMESVLIVIAALVALDIWVDIKRGARE